MKTLKLISFLTAFICSETWALPNAYQAGGGSFGQTNGEGGSGGGGQRGWHLSGFPKACEDLLTTKDWKSIEGREGAADLWDYNQLKIQTTDEGRTQTPITSAEQVGGAEALLAAANSYHVCQAYAFMTDVSSYDRDSDRNNPGQGFSSLSAGAIGCLNQAEQAQQQECMAQATEEMTCKQDGFVTEDYEACESLLKFADGFFIAKQGLQQVQVVASQVNAMDAQADVQREINAGNDATVAGLGAQEDSLRQGSQMAMQQGALDGAKAATLWAKISAFPTQEKLQEKCVRKFEENPQVTETMRQKIENAFDGIQGAPQNFSLPTEPTSIRTLCQEAINLTNDLMLMNTNILDQMRALATQAAIESAANFAKGAMLNKMAGDVGDAMKDIKSFEPPEFEKYEGPLPPTIDECMADPTKAGCPQTTPNGYAGFAGQNFNATMGGATQASSAAPNFDDDDNTGSGGSGDSTNGLVPNSFGAANSEIKRDNSFKDGTVAAAAYKQAAGGLGGGGAGGGGGGGAAPPGQAPQTGGAEEPKSSGITSAKVKMVGDGLATVGGRGRVGARKSKAKNPFSKLLGKNNKPKNGVLNFRGPAGIGKGGNLFQMISKRYGDVHSKKRLLEYKQK